MSKQKDKLKTDLVVYRERMGFTQQHVTRLLGTRNSTLLSRLEQGRRLPSLTTALKLGAIYRVPMEFLFPEMYSVIREEVRHRETKMFQSGGGMKGGK